MVQTHPASVCEQGQSLKCHASEEAIYHPIQSNAISGIDCKQEPPDQPEEGNLCVSFPALAD